MSLSSLQRWTAPAAAAMHDRSLHVFAGIWLVAVSATGIRESPGTAAAAIAELTGYGLFCWLTVVFTPRRPRVPPVEADSGTRTRPWTQVAIPAAVIAATFTGRIYDRPVWTTLLHRLEHLGVPLLDHNPYRLVDPTLYVLIPLPLLLLAGARPATLGLGRGYRTWRIALLWCAIPLAWIAITIATGARTWTAVRDILIGNLLQNGPVEEFLFRGALQPRLIILLRSPAAGITATSLAFGLWHVHANTLGHHGDLLAALCQCITGQAVAGLAFGVITWRTGNILAGSLLHTLGDALS